MDGWMDALKSEHKYVQNVLTVAEVEKIAIYSNFSCEGEKISLWCTLPPVYAPSFSSSQNVPAGTLAGIIVRYEFYTDFCLKILQKSADYTLNWLG